MGLYTRSVYVHTRKSLTVCPAPFTLLAFGLRVLLKVNICFYVLTSEICFGVPVFCYAAVLFVVTQFSYAVKINPRCFICRSVVMLFYFECVGLLTQDVTHALNVIQNLTRCGDYFFISQKLSFVTKGKLR